MDKNPNVERIVLRDAALEREAAVAGRFLLGGCLLGFAVGAGLVGLLWALS